MSDNPEHYVVKDGVRYDVPSTHMNTDLTPLQMQLDMTLRTAKLTMLSLSQEAENTPPGSGYTDLMVVHHEIASFVGYLEGMQDSLNDLTEV